MEVGSRESADDGTLRHRHEQFRVEPMSRWVVQIDFHCGRGNLLEDSDLGRHGRNLHLPPTVQIKNTALRHDEIGRPHRHVVLGDRGANDKCAGNGDQEASALEMNHGTS